MCEFSVRDVSSIALCSCKSNFLFGVLIPLNRASWPNYILGAGNTDCPQSWYPKFALPYGFTGCVIQIYLDQSFLCLH